MNTDESDTFRSEIYMKKPHSVRLCTYVLVYTVKLKHSTRGTTTQFGLDRGLK